MSDLANLMRSLDTAVAETMSERQEFRGADATRVVKRRRVVRTTAVVALAVLATASIGGGATALWWDISNPPVTLPVVTITATPSPSPSPSPTASPSPSPSIDPTVDAACPSRTDSLTAEEAKRIAESPTTGEVWLDEPVPIEDPFGPREFEDTWYKLGDRGQFEILAIDTSGFYTLSIAERSPEGSITWITRPYPGVLSPGDVPPDHGDSVNSSQCYESLAVPTEVAIDGTWTVNPAYVLSPAVPGLAGSESSTRTTVMQWGETRLIRDEAPVASAYGDYARTELAGAVAVNFWLELPFGWVHQLSFNPFEKSGYSEDYFNISCGSTSGPLLLARDVDNDDWESTVDLGGTQVSLGNANNPYGLERYDQYTMVKSDLGEPVTAYPSQGESPVVAGVPAQGGGWWIGVHYSYRASAWC